MEGLIFGILWYVLSLNFKNLLFRILRKKPCSCQCLLLYLGFSLSLSQFQLIFVSFVAISAVICHCFKAMSLVGIYLNKALQQPSWFQMHQVQCRDEYQIQLEVGDGLEGGKKKFQPPPPSTTVNIIIYNNIQYLQSANSQWSKSALHNKNNNKILNLQNYKTTDICCHMTVIRHLITVI